MANFQFRAYQVKNVEFLLTNAMLPRQFAIVQPIIKFLTKLKVF